MWDPDGWLVLPADGEEPGADLPDETRQKRGKAGKATKMETNPAKRLLPAELLLCF